MERTRRRVLQLAGASIATTLTAGCLSSAASSDDGNEPNDDQNDNDTDENDNDTDENDDGETPNGSDGNDGSFGDDEYHVDQPSYDIDEPDCGDDTDGNPLYLCENMPADPSLAFEQEATSGSVLADEGLSLDSETEAGGDHQFYATFLTADSDLDRLEQDSDGATAEFIKNTDFDSEVVLVVETGWGSGSVIPHLERIEATDDGLHAFGCYRRPCIVTTDVTARTVAVRFERPDTFSLAGVTLTVDAETQITFDTTDSVVTVETV